MKMKTIDFNHLDYLFSKIEEFEEYVRNLKFPDNDIRKVYFELTLNILKQYYVSFCCLLLAEIGNTGEVLIGKEMINDFQNHINRLFSIGRIELEKNMRNGINRSLIIEAWSIFEFCVTCICEEILDQETKGKLLFYDYSEIMKVLRNYSIKEVDKDKIAKVLKKRHLTHVPITRKYNKLFSLFATTNYTGNKNDDKEFLEFFGKYRNCFHSNFIYHGNNKTYTYCDADFIFIDGRPITHSIELNIMHHFNLVLELSKVVSRLFNSIKTNRKLEYPLEE